MNKEVEPLAEPVGEKQKPEKPEGVKAHVALGRCRYKGTGGKILVSEPGETLKDPIASDLAELEAMGLVGKVDSDVAGALSKLKQQDPAALRAMLGFDKG